MAAEGNMKTPGWQRQDPELRAKLVRAVCPASAKTALVLSTFPDEFLAALEGQGFGCDRGEPGATYSVILMQGAPIAAGLWRIARGQLGRRGRVVVFGSSARLADMMLEMERNRIRPKRVIVGPTAMPWGKEQEVLVVGSLGKAGGLVVELAKEVPYGDAVGKVV
jgi:hypothetical protein